jgi:thymidylate kinase
VTPRPLVVALEGPCCAGKTTLGRLLARELHGLSVALVPCYADHAGGGRFLPRQEAASVAEREQALHQLLVVEAGRLARVPQGCDVIVEDRSVHTLLAHSYTFQLRTGTDFLGPSQRLLRASPAPAWPDLVLYLDLPQDAVQHRNPGKFPPGSIYTDPGFNAAVRAYFRRLAGGKAPRVAWLDATLDLPELTRLAVARIRHETGQELTGRALWTRCRYRDG